MVESFSLGSRHMSADAVRHARLVQLAQAETVSEKIEIVARLILDAFDHYYFWSRYIPNFAKQAFEAQDWGRSFTLSKERLSLYSNCINELGPRLRASWAEIADREELWRELEDEYLALIAGRYEADLAFAFIHSVRRKIYQDEWKPVLYSFAEAGRVREVPTTPVFRSFAGGERISRDTITDILAIPEFSTPYRDLEGDAALLTDRINDAVAALGPDSGGVVRLDMIDAGLFRNRGAYLLGRIVLGGGDVMPLAIALLNEGDGIFVDAVLTTQADVHNLFSSTLANFHVTNPYYHELSRFLFSIMPRRPLGLHYSTIGFNHVGKVAIMEELAAELGETGERLEIAVGFRGTVAIGFSAPSSSYVLKVIRDTPTANYKWGVFEGVGTVLGKYRVVHEINRTGSMLDNAIYTNVKLAKSWFDPDVLAELLGEAGGNVSLQDDDVVFKHLIVQLKLIPLPIFLETANEEDAATAVVNLGNAIKNNAAADIFNKDLDGRNYGVGKFLKVFLFDYDALERFTEVKIRTNAERFDGEEDVPDWVFEEGVVFLPEEIESGLRIDDRRLRRVFRKVHGDTLTTAYWERVQRDLQGGKVPRIKTYPDACRLVRVDDAPDG